MKSMIIIFILSSLSLTAQTPCPRNQPVMVYHGKLDAIFIFGGLCSGSKTRLNDFWMYRNKRWAKIEDPVMPDARSGHAMVYDPLFDRIVLFGGKNDRGELLEDTWVWKDGRWENLKFPESPEPRQSHRLVETDQGIILFGGSGGTGEVLSDTWLLHEDWTQIISTVSPPARKQHTLAFDRARTKVVLFGGLDNSGATKDVFGDTWEFNGSKWSLSANNPELARDHHAMAYCPAREATILFGGYNGGYLGDTRAWDGDKWQVVEATGPSPRAGKPALLANPTDSSLILYGGWGRENTPLTDFWFFDPKLFSWKPDSH